MTRVWCGALVLAVLVPLAAFPAAGAERELTLSGAVSLALKQNPTLEASRQGVAQAEGRLTQTSSRWWPQLTGSASYKPQLQRILARRRLGRLQQRRVQLL